MIYIIKYVYSVAEKRSKKLGDFTRRSESRVAGNTFELKKLQEDHEDSNHFQSLVIYSIYKLHYRTKHETNAVT